MPALRVRVGLCLVVIGGVVLLSLIFSPTNDPFARFRTSRAWLSRPADGGKDALINATARALFPHPRQAADRNALTLRRILRCRSLGTCTDKEKHVVLLASAHFTRVQEGMFAQKATHPAGEGIWADALIWALNKLGYPYLTISGPEGDHAQANNRLSEIYNLIGDGVGMVIGDYLSAPACLRNERCVRSEAKNPFGVETHKLFIFDGWADKDLGHPHGRRWHLSFYDRQKYGFTYLGLTIEHYCTHFPLVPPSQRLDAIYILGKERAYFHSPHLQMFDDSGVYERVSRRTGVKFTIGTIQKDAEGEPGTPTLPRGIEDVGAQTREEFIDRISHHRALLGIGSPPQPSSPLEAMCLGTPFINPVWSGYRSQPDRTKWEAQHKYLTSYNPPNVYHYQDKHEEDLVAAIEAIKKRPMTERFIPPDMTAKAYLARVERLIRTDWKALADERGRRRPQAFGHR